MTGLHIDNLLIAGMGRTGMSVAKYCTDADVDYRTCDDRAEYEDCVDVMAGFQGYVIKSPGISPEALPGNDSTHIINDIELFMRISKKPVIMVTGTNGKSTVVTLLEHLLCSAGVQAVACGNNGLPVFQAMKKNIGLYVLELSSYQLENMTSLSSAGSVLLNIGVDHVDRYRDMQEYSAVKQKIYRDSLVSVYPVNAEGVVDYRENIRGYMAVTEHSSVTYRLDGDFIARNNENYIEIGKLALNGVHNYLNVCAALALIDRFCLDRQQVVSSLGTFTGLPHRMQTVCLDSRGRKWINDSKSTNVHSLRAALGSQPVPVCLIAGGKGKGEDYRQVFEEFSSVIGRLVLFGEDARIMEQQSGCIHERVVVDTLSEAVEHVGDFGGDILFSPACASFDQYRDYVARGEDFENQVRRVASC